jgi:hypothetical protein
VPIYFLFATIYKRSRVFNAAALFEMRYGSHRVDAVRFYCTLNTVPGQEDRLRRVGIELPAMPPAGDLGVTSGHGIDERALADLYQAQSKYKLFGASSTIEILKEPGLGWYYRGFVQILAACLLLLGGAWALAE